MNGAEITEQQASIKAQQGRFAKAAEGFAAAAALYLTRGDTLEAASCHLLQAHSLNDAKRYEQALQALDLAEPLFARSGGMIGHQNWLLCRMERGNYLYFLGRYSEAMNDLADTGHAFLTNGETDQALRCEMVMSWALRDQGTAENNGLAVEKSIAQLEELRVKYIEAHDHGGAAQCDQSAGLGLVWLGRYEEAIQHYDRSAQWAGKMSPIRRASEAMAKDARKALEKSKPRSR